MNDNPGMYKSNTCSSLESLKMESQSSSVTNALTILESLSNKIESKPKFRRIMDDYEDELLARGQTVPRFVSFPESPHFDMEDRISLWTVLEFIKDHSQGFLNMEQVDILDLCNLFYILFLFKKIDKLEGLFVNWNGQEYESLLDIYTILYSGLASRNEITEPQMIPELMAKFFSKNDSEEILSLSIVFKTVEFVDIPPKTHLKALNALLDAILDSKRFHFHMNSVEENLHELKRAKWHRSAHRKELENSIIVLDSNISVFDKKIQEFSRESPFALLEDEEESALSSHSSSSMMNGENIHGIRSHSTDRSLAKARKAERKAEIQKKELELNEWVKQRNDLVSQISEHKRTLLEYDEEDAEFKTLVGEYSKTLRGDRCWGLDRDGRIYWWFQVQHQLLEETLSTDDKELLYQAK